MGRAGPPVGAASVERYGRAEVETWYWEVWNEPNIFYWRGTPEEYHKLYDYAVDAVKRALPTARVGGPHVAGPRSPGGRGFLARLPRPLRPGHESRHGQERFAARLHRLPRQGRSPEFVDGHVRTGIAAQLQDIDRGFEIVASYPELRGKPIIIGESDPDGCAACPATIYPQNGYRNGTLYASYTAAAFARKYLLADKHGVNFEGAVTWAFEFEDQPYFAGFRVLSTNGIPLAGAERLPHVRHDGRATARRRELGRGRPGGDPHRTACGASPTSRPSPACGPASSASWSGTIHDDDVPGPAAAVELSLNRLPGRDRPVLLQHFRIDQDHSNAFEAWKRMGSPPQPTPEQYAGLERSSHLALLSSPGMGPTRGWQAHPPVRPAPAGGVAARLSRAGRFEVTSTASVSQEAKRHVGLADESDQSRSRAAHRVGGSG